MLFFLLISVCVFMIEPLISFTFIWNSNTRLSVFLRLMRSSY